MSQVEKAIAELATLSGDILNARTDDQAAFNRIGSVLAESAQALRHLDSHIAALLHAAAAVIQGPPCGGQQMGESQRMLIARAIDLTCGQLESPNSQRSEQIEMLRSQLGAWSGPGQFRSDPSVDIQHIRSGMSDGDETLRPDTAGQPEGPQQPERTENRTPENPARREASASLVQDYIDSAREHLGKIEESLLQLESDPTNETYIHEALRAFHTLKGSSAMMGFSPIEHLAHLAENLLSQARSGQVAIVDGRTDIALQACDMLGSMVQQVGGLEANSRLQSPDGYDHLARQLSLAAKEEWQGSALPQSPSHPHCRTLSDQTDRTILAEVVSECLQRLVECQSDLLDQPVAEMQDLQEIAAILSGVDQAAVMMQLDDLKQFSEDCKRWFDGAIAAGRPLRGGKYDLCMGTIDAMRRLLKAHDRAAKTGMLELPAQVEQIRQSLCQDDPDQAEEPAETMRIGEILVGRGQVEPELVGQALADNATDLLGKVLLEQGVGGRDVSSALRLQRQLDAGQASPHADTTVRVSSKRMDDLVNLIGELLVSHSQVRAHPVISQNRKWSGRRISSRRKADGVETPPAGSRPVIEKLSQSVERTNGLLKDLHDLAVSLRMVAMRGLFEKARRMTRDLARRGGKDIHLLTEGEETEIDRTTVELLSDPLVHLVRNAVDHGIEQPKEREQEGKNRQGILTMRASRVGAHVLLSLADDGAGLDLDAIRAKAVAQGLIEQHAQLTKAEISSLIFHPGFTTSDTVDGISGRGVGMDVVRRSIEALHGRIDVFSQAGKGTRFEIRLPMTTAIEDVLIVDVAGREYLLPAADIERTVRMDSSEAQSVAGGHRTVLINDRPVPLLDLGRFLSGQDIKTDRMMQLVLLARGRRRCAVQVDRVVSQSQVVIKPLGRLLSRAAHLTGGAVLGNGQLGLVLDATFLLSQAGHCQKSEPAV